MTMLTRMSVESPVHGNMHAGFGGAGRGNGLADKAAPRPGSTLFKPCSYGFRPGRRPHDAIAEIHNFASNGYGWVLEADIEACFDEISHVGLMDRVRARVGDNRVAGLVRAFLKSGILSEDLVTRDTNAGTPQGGGATRGRTVVSGHIKGGSMRSMV